jgi:hypothetical protein
MIKAVVTDLPSCRGSDFGSVMAMRETRSVS